MVKNYAEDDDDDRKPRRLGDNFCLLLLIPLALLCFYVYFFISSEKPGFHLSLGQDDNEYYLTWSADNYYQILVTSCTRNEANIWRMVTPDQAASERRRLSKIDRRHFKYIFKEKLTVEPNVKCTYFVQECSCAPHCIDEDSSHCFSSQTFTFTPKPLRDSLLPLRMAFYGDLGIKNGKSIPRLTKDANTGMYDLIFHNGDFAYDLNTESGLYGDKFMAMIEPIASIVPYQTSVGNHEIAENFTEYDTRFTMINSGPIETGTRNNFYYSFNAGPIHFVVISTEFYYFLNRVGIASLHNQYEWLKRDLAHATSASERLERPWIVVFGHRPMYCSSRDNDDCSKSTNLLRRGLPFTGAYAFEKLFYDYGVDVEIYSHEHQYERFLPIYDGKVYNGTSMPDNPYHNPRAPVHIISGSAGCQEDLDPFEGTPVTGSVRQISDYGYSRLQATKCKLSFQQVSDDQDGTIVDEFSLSKDRQNFPTVGELSNPLCQQ